MDEVYQRAAYKSDVYSRQQQQHQQQQPYQRHDHNQRYHRRPVGTSPPHNYHNNLYRKVSASNTNTTYYLTGQNMIGIVITILVIYLFSRKDGFGRLFSARQERGGTLNLLMDLYLEVLDFLVAWAHAAIELCRSLGLHSLGNLLEDWTPLHDMTTSSGGGGGGVRNSSGALVSPNGAGGCSGGGGGAAAAAAGRGRRRNMGLAPSGGGGRMASNRMPELEETDVNKLKALQQGETTTRIINGPLEPAFLRDEDYPAGWLVFDPVLGVVSKIEADKYRLEQLKHQKKQYLEDQEDGAAAHHHQQQQQQKQSAFPHQSPTANNPVSARRPAPAVLQHQRKQQQQQQQTQTPTQYISNSTNNNSNNKSNPARPIRPTTKVIPNPSATTIHTPQTIGVNG